MLVEDGSEVRLDDIPASILVYNLQKVGVEELADELAAAQYISNLHVNQLQELTKYSINTIFINEQHIVWFLQIRLVLAECMMHTTGRLSCDTDSA